MRKTITVIALVAVATMISLPCHAGIFTGKKHKCDFTEAEGNEALIKAAKKCGFYTSNRGVGKKVPAPKKVAIVNFQIRYDKASNTAVKKFYEPGGTSFKCTETQYVESGSSRVVKRDRECWAEVEWGKTRREFSGARFELEDKDIYQFITNAIYGEFVLVLTELGYEVVPMEQVKAAETYAKLEGQGSAKDKKKFIRTSAYGLKNLSMQGMLAANKLPGLNKDLETDAVIDLFATVGLHFDKQDNLYMCIGSENIGLGTGINIEVMAGFKKQGQLGKKVMYASKASATGGIPSMGCEGVALTNDSGVTYVVNSANMVARAAKLAMLMLDAAFNK